MSLYFEFLNDDILSLIVSLMIKNDKYADINNLTVVYLHIGDILNKDFIYLNLLQELVNDYLYQFLKKWWNKNTTNITIWKHKYKSYKQWYYSIKGATLLINKLKLHDTLGNWGYGLLINDFNIDIFGDFFNNTDIDLILNIYNLYLDNKYEYDAGVNQSSPQFNIEEPKNGIYEVALEYYSSDNTSDVFIDFKFNEDDIFQFMMILLYNNISLYDVRGTFHSEKVFKSSEYIAKEYGGY